MLVKSVFFSLLVISLALPAACGTDAEIDVKDLPVDTPGCNGDLDTFFAVANILAAASNKQVEKVYASAS